MPARRGSDHAKALGGPLGLPPIQAEANQAERPSALRAARAKWRRRVCFVSTAVAETQDKTAATFRMGGSWGGAERPPRRGVG
jgi:hypothetical protein